MSSTNIDHAGEMEEGFCYIVTPQQAKQRLDVLLSSYPEIGSRTLAQRMLKNGLVAVNESRKSPAYQVRCGDQIYFTLFDPEPSEVIPQAGNLDILYEDKALLVLNKPAGMVVHPAPGHTSQTLVNYLLHHCQDLSGIGGVLRPGIVHRLDKATSGVLVIAKTDQAHRHLAQQFQAHSIYRQYKALVWGNPLHQRGTIQGPIGRDPKNRKKMAIVAHGKPATTYWKVVSRFSGFTLLDCHLETGRTHQIRVHLSSQKMPIWGDAQYGQTQLNRSVSVSLSLRTYLAEFDRNALHAEELGFEHPLTQQYQKFVSPLPEDFLRLIEVLRQEKS